MNEIAPCPNPECGAECKTQLAGSTIYVACTSAYQYGHGAPPLRAICGYRSPGARYLLEAIDLHNRIARAAREASELSHLAGHYLVRAERAEAERDAARAALARWLPPDPTANGACASCGMTFSGHGCSDWGDPDSHHLDCRWAVAARMTQRDTP